MIKLFNEDCGLVLGSQTFKDITKNKKVVIVTDPPFNVGYHYNLYNDDLDEETYFEWLEDIFHLYPFVVIHYPEAIYKLSFQLERFPEKIVAWTYNSNTAKQHRDVAFFDVFPDFNLVKQPYKNPNDKRIKERIKNGDRGGRLYDWWNINQVKNVSKEKTNHPCQMPEEVMNNIIGILPEKDNLIVVDPFMGSGTTGISCKKYGVDFIGMEIDETYYQIAKQRIEEANFQEEMKI